MIVFELADKVVYMFMFTVRSYESYVNSESLNSKLSLLLSVCLSSIMYFPLLFEICPESGNHLETNVVADELDLLVGCGGGGPRHRTLTKVSLEMGLCCKLGRFGRKS